MAFVLFKAGTSFHVSFIFFEEILTEISVIIPTYNRAQLTATAVQSVLDQTFEDFELIVIDDGSTDNTEETMASFTDPRLVYIKQENGGVAAACNTGLAKAKGKWISFLDSDDQYLPRKFEIQLAAVADEPEAGVVYGRYYGTTTLREEKTITGRCFHPYPLADLLIGPIFHKSTTMMRRDLLETVGYFDPQFWVGEEWELNLRMAMTKCKFICVYEPVSIIQIQEVSLSRDIHKHESNGRIALDKTFNNPNFPKEFEYMKSFAYAAHQLRVAASAYISDEPELGREPLSRAIEKEPALLSEKRDFLITKFFNYVQGVSLEDPSVTLKKISQNLPNNPKLRSFLIRELWGRYHLNKAFNAVREHRPRDCRQHAIKAISHNPTYIKNRGLVSIYFRSFLGKRFLTLAN
ncbi:MAG: glycosyltransferase [Chloroflexota bacterium]